MGLATIDPHSQKKCTDIHKIPKFGVNRLVLTEIQAFKPPPQKNLFLNACISVKTSLINTKLEDFVNLGVLFLTKWINSC